jgi:hypothetical protein
MPFALFFISFFWPKEATATKSAPASITDFFILK